MRGAQATTLICGMPHHSAAGRAKRAARQMAAVTSVRWTASDERPPSANSPSSTLHWSSLEPQFAVQQQSVPLLL